MTELQQELLTIHQSLSALRGQLDTFSSSVDAEFAGIHAKLNKILEEVCPGYYKPVSIST